MEQNREDRPDSVKFGIVLAEAVRTRRKELGLTQADAARLAGCDERFLRDLEHAKSTVRLDKVLAVVSALGLRIEVAGE